MGVKLIAKDKNGNFQCEGKCKLTIDSISQLLLVESVVEGFKLISAMFNWKFVAQNKILFVFAKQNFQDSVLIFDDENKCVKVNAFLLKKRANLGSKELIQERFLHPFLKQISNNDNPKMREIFSEWIQTLEGEEKRKYNQFLKDNGFYSLFYPDGEDNIRKRKFEDVNKKEEPAASKQHINKCILKNIIETPNFEVLTYTIKNKNVSRTKLSVFQSFGNKKYCYEYCWTKPLKKFICHGCSKKGKHLSAKIVKRNGKDAVLLNGTQHVCEIRHSKEIIQKPNFEIISSEHRKDSVKTLVIFLDSSRTKCYEFAWYDYSKAYICRGCLVGKKKHQNHANICQKEDGSEFVMLKSNNHICEIRKFNPEKFRKKETLDASNFKIFQIFKGGFDRSKLVIFTSSDKIFCYEYSWKKDVKSFQCCGCRNRNKSVMAEVCKNENDGSEYLKLNTNKHICVPREFDPDKFKISDEIVEHSDFKVFYYQHNGTLISKLIVFCATNKNLCYEYFWNVMAKIYFCSYCPREKHVTATVLKNGKENEYLKLSKAEHVCDLLEFDAEKYKDDKIVKKPMYKITSTTLRNIKHNILVLFTSDEKRFFYKFIYHTKEKYFYCSKCNSSKVYITAVIQNEGKEDEYVSMSNQTHVCEPFEYSKLTNGNIITSPNYQLIKRKHGNKIIQHLVVFTNEEKSECFEYSWTEQSKYFICNSCQKTHKCFVFAKIFTNDMNEECVELSDIVHKCTPIKFVPENIISNIVKEPNFKLWEEMFGKKLMQRLTIFDSKNRNLGYIYSYQKSLKRFVCMKCTTKKTFVSAKLLQFENGENYIEMGKTAHICKP